jgi:hypothetical protein
MKIQEAILRAMNKMIILGIGGGNHRHQRPANARWADTEYLFFDILKQFLVARLGGGCDGGSKR